MENGKLVTFSMAPPPGPRGRGMDPPAGLEGQRTKSSKGVPQVILVDEAIPVLVHDGEGLWKEVVGWSAQEKSGGRSPRGWARG